MREKPSIPEERLLACLQEQYDLSAVTLDFLPLGLDTRAGVYRAVSEQGTPYFLKAKYGSLYKPSCLVPGYLRDQGIAAVVAPLTTRQGTLWTQVGAWTLIVYPFIEGDTGWNPAMTSGNWQAVGTALKQIHRVALPPGGFPSMRTETFDPAEYCLEVYTLETHQAGSESGSKVEHALRSSWMAHQSTIHAVVTSLVEIAGLLQGRSGAHVICHADLHPGNIIRDQAGHVFIIDWDDVMLAPKERDFIFVEEQTPSPFMQGYGPAEIDWTALAYYCYERVVQDLIECAHEVFFREDLGIETKAEAARLFETIFAAGTMLDAARAAAHLQS
ncbi:MAG: aminoglycoside phosphotransferase family protein [Chloroflexi bacterium]|nr:aminoglycoside phosphotransferase family protein [Chloroflexota bacterium]